MATVDRFSTTFLDVSPEDLGMLRQLGSEEAQTAGTGAEDGLTAEGGFGDSFVEPPPLSGGSSHSIDATPITTCPPSVTTVTTSEKVRFESTNPFSEYFVLTSNSDDQQQTRLPSSDFGSVTSSQEGCTASSGNGVNPFTSPARSSHAQEVTVVAEINQPHHERVDSSHSKTSETWEKFEAELDNQETPTSAGVPLVQQVPTEIGFDTSDTPPPSVNGIVEQHDRSPTPTKVKPVASWEKFEDAPKAMQKKISTSHGEHGAVCAADAMVSDLQWTALDDSVPTEFLEESSDTNNLPFRKTQSMRATTNRKVQIVDALKQRRLSNSSLDRMMQTQFVNEDELTKKFSMERDWQVFVKLDKRVKGTRTKWLPVNVSVKDNILLIKRSAPPSMPISSSTIVPADTPPLHEIRLHHNHTLTPPVPRSYDRKTKLHQIKLQQTRVREKRTLKRWLFVEHVSSAHTIVKIGCPDLNVVESLSDQINEAVRQLPVTRPQGVAYRMNEVFIDVKDHSDILMNCDGAVLERMSLNRVYVQAFVTGSPECRLVFNDLEALLLQGKGQMTNSMSRQVRLNDVVLHPCVDKSAYKASRELKFKPVDGYPFELLRCSIEPYISPPINVSALMEYDQRKNTVQIIASFTVRKKLNIQLRPVKDLVIKFPIPSSWSSLFLADTRFGGKKSVRSTSALRGSFRRKIKSSSCQIQTYLGSAKYEPEHGAIMWRIGNYTRTEVSHNLRCDVQLKPGMHRPDVSREHAEVTYSLPGNSTGLQVRSFKVDTHTPERWVKYEILYHYRVQMFPDLSID